MRTQVFTISSLVALALLCPTASFAQDAPVFTESFFLLTDAGEDTADVCLSSFGRPLTNSGAFVERNSPEVADAVAGCLEDTASPTFARECELAISQSEVDYIVLAEIRDLDDGMWMFEIAVRSPALNAGVWSGDEVADGSNAVLAARDACAALGQAFLSTRMEDDDVDPTIDVEEEHDEEVEVIPDPTPDPPDEPDRVVFTTVTLDLDNAPRGFRGSFVSSQGTEYECDRRLTMNRPCVLDNVASGGGLLTLNGGMDGFNEAIEIFDEPTIVQIEGLGRERQTQRIVGAVLMGVGFVSSIAYIGAAGTNSNLGVFFGLFGLSAVGGGVFAHGYLGEFNWDVQSRPY